MAATPIIGMGAVCAAGSGVDRGFERVAQGADLLAPLAAFASGLKITPLCAEITFPVDTDTPNRTLALALSACDEAMRPFPDRAGLRTGLVFATTVAGMTRSERFYEAFVKDPSVIGRASDELAYHEPASLSGFLCERLGLQGYHTISTACSTGLHAVGMAKRLVERGVYDLCLAAGADVLSMLTVRGFASLTLIDPSGCRPFDKRRAGISLGEGAAAMLLASPQAAGRLAARPDAFVSGWGASADAHHMSAPHPEGAGAREAVAGALAEAGLQPHDIRMIAAHGTGTPDNDLSEIKAMRAVFGELPPFCSMKRTLGHTLAASGILEAVFAVCAMRRGKVPATGGFEQVDDSIGAPPSAAIDKEITHVLKNSFGFGGNNAVVVLSAAVE